MSEGFWFQDVWTEWSRKHSVFVGRVHLAQVFRRANLQHCFSAFFILLNEVTLGEVFGVPIGVTGWLAFDCWLLPIPHYECFLLHSDWLSLGLVGLTDPLSMLISVCVCLMFADFGLCVGMATSNVRRVSCDYDAVDGWMDGLRDWMRGWMRTLSACVRAWGSACGCMGVP